jgi:hypothetical protein
VLPQFTSLESRCLFSAAGPLAITPADTSDLTGVLGGKIPYSAIAGQNPKITQKLIVTNNSTDFVQGNITATLYLSSNGVVDANSVNVGSENASGYLRPYDQIAFPFKITSTPATMSAGNYNVIAQITDPDGNVVYVTSSLTIAISPPSIDLTGSFSKTPKPGKTGKTNVSFTLLNNGNTTANGPLTFNIEQSPDGSLSDATYITDELVNINVKGHKTKKISKTIPLPAGTYHLVIQLDPSNTFNDTNISNNVFSTGPITVG